jgi:hypothetical protein
MKKLLIIIIIIIIIIASFFFIRYTITGQTVKEEKIHTYTKDICNESNYCQDHIIRCKGSETGSTTPISGAAVQFDRDWEDPRTEEQRNTLC